MPMSDEADHLSTADDPSSRFTFNLDAALVKHVASTLRPCLPDLSQGERETFALNLLLEVQRELATAIVRPRTKP